LNSASGSHPKIQSDMENYRTISETQSLLLTFRITQQYLKINLFFSHWELHNIQNSISFDIEKYATSKNLFWHWELHNMCPRITITQTLTCLSVSNVIPQVTIFLIVSTLIKKFILSLQRPYVFEGFISRRFVWKQKRWS
jgi:hypothetical protein